ncbi:MAG TPA: VOC family protein [Acidimicrobiia bacterium]|nr:VOC family protein [Acidimicrobiia bacterium]
MRLDHVAIAAPDHRPVLRSLTGQLGGLVISGGTPPGAGFRAMQIRLGRGLEGMTVELLEPYQPEHNDFLVRFLNAIGGGVHHLTFKTDDVVAERERLRGLGIEPVEVDFSNPGWREMFVHPKDGHGTVIQIAQSSWESPPMDEWLASMRVVVFDQSKSGPWWDPASVVGSDRQATLRRVVIETPDTDAGRTFYRDVLQGEVDGDRVRWDGGEILLAPGEGRPRVARLEITGHPSVSIGGVDFVQV